jgi:hypothetical protein
MKNSLKLLGAILVAATAFNVQAKTLKVLTIGNSFSICLLKQLPQCAAAMPDCTLDLCSLYIGGCSLERHWNNVVAATNKEFRPYGVNWSYASVKDKKDAPVAKVVVKGKANIPEMLKADKWDVVTLQQASHFSWQPKTYQPFGDNLVKTIRELAPQAQIMVQQTWSYTPYDGRLKKWGLTPATMHEKLKAAYAEFAKPYGFKIIPTGDAVQDFRKAMPSPDGITGDPCGSPTGKDKFHLNREGNYLQACVWLAALFDCDVTKLTYCPDFLPEARAVQMRKSAMAAVKP